MNRNITSRGFITRNIFDNVFHIFNRNWMKGYFFLYQVFTFNFDNTWMVYEFFNDLSHHYSSVFQKCFNFFTASEKLLMKVLAISSLFTSKVSFLANLFAFAVISYFSIKMILESIWACLLKK